MSKTFKTRCPSRLYFRNTFVLVYINDLPLSLNSVSRLFVDDTALCINENSSENLEILANHELKNINLWIVSNGLTLHLSKTQALSIAPFTNLVSLCLLIFVITL